MITAHLTPNTRKDDWYVLTGDTPDEPCLVSHFHATNETEALFFAFDLLQQRWPDKNNDLKLHVHPTKGTP